MTTPTTTPITIYLKNMAGDVIPIEADRSWSEEDLLARMAMLYPGKYPSGRTQLLRPSGPLEEEVVSVWVETGPYVERWMENGKSRVRYILPYEHGVIHIRRIILFYSWVRFYAERVLTEPDAKPSPDTVIPYPTLYESIRAVWPEVTPSDMRQIYSVILPDLEEESVKKGLIYTYEYSQEEPLECECGLVVQRCDLLCHEKSAEHRERILKN